MRLVSIVFLITVILIGLGIYFLIKFFKNKNKKELKNSFLFLKFFNKTLRENL